MSPFQEVCLVEAAKRANDFAQIVLDARRSGRLEHEDAVGTIMEALGCVAAGFEDDLDHATFQRAVQRCGLTRGLRGVPANDDWFHPAGAA